MNAATALALAAALHAGFQATVSVVVYPTLAEVPGDVWATAHDRHSRRIVLLVVPVYAAAAAACTWVLLAGPRDADTLVAVGGLALAGLATAVRAAPLHGRLGRGRDEDLVRALLVADRVRLVGALVAVVAAVLALFLRG